MSRAEPDSAPIPATGMGCFPREAGQFLALLHPPSAEMNPPSRIVPHRHDASAAGTNELPAVTQRSVLEQNKIVLGDLLVHIANHATTKCTPRADDLFARACDHHVWRSFRMRSAHLVEPNTMEAKAAWSVAACGAGFLACRKAGSESRRRGHQHRSPPCVLR